MNFDALPTDKPSGFVVPEGTYRAVISDAGMKQPKDKSKPMYLNFKLDLFNIDNGEKVGTIFDSLFESEQSLVMYKIKRFMLALDLKLTSFELSDLAKLINNKELLVDVKTDKQEGKADRSIVDVTKDMIYYPVSSVATAQGDAGAVANVSGPINAEDGLPTSIEDVPEVF